MIWPLPSESAHATSTPHPPHRRLAWTLVTTWLVLTITAQVACGIWLSQVGQGLSRPSLAVAAIGLCACLVVALIFRVLDRRFGSIVRLPARMLALAGLVLGTAGLVWVRHDLEVPALIGGGSILFVLLVFQGVHPLERERAKAKSWMVGAALVFAAATLGAANTPSGLAIRFRSYEGSLNGLIPRVLALTLTRSNSSGCIPGATIPPVPGFGQLQQVCSHSGVVTFYAIGNSPVGDYAYVYNREPQLHGGESCVLHLDGPWWEVAPGGGGVPCPSGFTYIPGG